MCHDLVPASSKEPCNHSLTPPPLWDEEENQTKKAKLMGWDKDSSTEQQRQKKITTLIHRQQFSHLPVLSSLTSSKLSSLASFPGQLPQLNANHDIISYKTSHLTG